MRIEETHRAFQNIYPNVKASLIYLALNRIEGNPIVDSERVVLKSPFSRNNERYQDLYTILLRNGMNEERIQEIFSSKAAKKIDLTPVRLMSKIGNIPKLDKAEVKANKKFLSKIPMVIKHLNKYKKYYDLAESGYGVNREIIAAILLKETALGSFKNYKHDSFTVLNTMLAFFELPKNPNTRMKIRMSRLIHFAKENLAGLLLFCHKYNIDITKKRYPSSYAGAIGIPQFAPAWLGYAVSAENSIPDLYKTEDGILSVGNVFKNSFGWSEMIKYKKLENINDIIKKWHVFNKQRGVSFSVNYNLEGMPLRRFDQAFIDIPNIAYIGDYVRTVMQYNFSSNYALGILQIAYHTNKLIEK